MRKSSYSSNKYATLKCAQYYSKYFHVLLFDTYFYACMHACCHFSHVQLFVTLYTVACKAPLLWDSPGKNIEVGCPCPPPRDLPEPGIKPMALRSSALAGKFFTSNATSEVPYIFILPVIKSPKFSHLEIFAFQLYLRNPLDFISQLLFW